MRVRLVEAKDRSDWLRMRSSLWPDCPAERHIAEMDRIFADLSAAPVFVAEDDAGKPCGFIEASLRTYAEGCVPGAPIGYIEGWYVEPEQRRVGVGAILVRMAEAWAILQGCQEMASDCLVDNSASYSAHLSMGYRETERLIHFRKSLQESKNTGRRSARKR